MGMIDWVSEKTGDLIDAGMDKVIYAIDHPVEAAAKVAFVGATTYFGGYLAKACETPILYAINNMGLVKGTEHLAGCALNNKILAEIGGGALVTGGGGKQLGRKIIKNSAQSLGLAVGIGTITLSSDNQTNWTSHSSINNELVSNDNSIYSIGTMLGYEENVPYTLNAFLRNTTPSTPPPVERKLSYNPVPFPNQD